MDRESIYYRQVQLLLQLLPFIAKHDCFALKGGTAINLFIRNFPRLSVDIDLVYLPVLDREESLKGIKAALDDIAKSVLAYIPLAEFLAVRRQLIDLINGKITQEEKEFLLSFKNKEPDWTLLGLDNIDKLPAVRWKRKNLSKMPAEKHANALKRLSYVLDVVM